MPKDVLELPIFNTVCLLSSSVTIHLAVRALRNAKVGAFGLWWFVTIALGAIFLVGTAREWQRLIFEKGLTISTNLFGTTYYSLVGLHAFHVTAGLIFLAIGMIFTFLGKVKPEHSERAKSFRCIGISLMRSGSSFSPWLCRRSLRKAESHGSNSFNSGSTRGHARHGQSAGADSLAHHSCIRHHSPLCRAAYERLVSILGAILAVTGVSAGSAMSSHTRRRRRLRSKRK